MTPKEFTDHVFKTVTEAVVKAVSLLRKEIAEVRAELKLIPSGKDGSPGKDGRDGVDGKDGQIGPRGEKGLDGKDGIDGKDGKDGKDGIDGKDGSDGVNGKDGAPGKDGLNGKDGKDGIDGKDGAPGRDGKDGTPGKNGVDGVVGPRGDKGDVGISGKDGVPGKDGRDGRDGKDGKDGRDGVDGEPGRDAAAIHVLDSIDEQKSYPRGSFAKHRHGFWYAAKDTHGMNGWMCIAPGIDHIGIDFKDFRNWTVTAVTSDGREFSKEASLPVVIHRGQYKHGIEYAMGDSVSWSGSQWIAIVEKATNPPMFHLAPGMTEEDRHWQLAVKKGDKGKDSPQ